MKPCKTIERLFVLLPGLFFAAMINAGEVDVVDAVAECDDSCDFHVTLQHADEGWKHYANRWEVLTPAGKIIATRVLVHPHSPAPFTRSLSGVKIPAGVSEVIVRGHDLVHAYGGKQMTLKIPAK